MDAAIENLLPQQLRERTISVLIDQLLGVARQTPLCLIVDDVQWLDPTSRELLQILLEKIERYPILLVLSGREEITPEWAGRAQTTIRLGRLSPEQVANMMQGLFGGAFLQRRIVEQVVSRTDGVPLFVEEVGRVIFQNPSHDDDTTFVEQSVPSSLDETLAARLDRLGTAKEIAQAAAVTGRSVRRDVLAAVFGRKESDFEDELSVLLRAGILERSDGASEETFCFRHGLLRDAAYSSLVRERRRELHDRVARSLQTLDAETVERHPEVLAYHLTEAGRADDAAPYWLEAARRSLARSALTEASRTLRRALDAVEKLPESEEVLRLRIRVRALLGPALISLKGPNSAETKELYTTAYELCRHVPEEATHFPIYWGWWRLEPASLERSGALLKRASERNHPELLLQAHHCSWATHFNRGSFAQCEEHTQAGLSIYHQGDFTHHARLYGNHDAKACAHGNLCQLFWMQGKLKAAIEEEEKSLAWADSIDHLGTRVHAMGMTLLHHVYRRDYKEVFNRSDEMISFTSEYGLASHGAAGSIFQGWVMAVEGDSLAGLKMIEEGFARQREVCTNEDFPIYLCLLAEVLTLNGKPDLAVERILAELPDFEACQLRVWIPELLRVLGDTILTADPNLVEEALHRYTEARQLAEAQQVPMLQLRIAVSEARLQERLGASDLASALLETALSQITEEDGSRDLLEARQLQVRLSETATVGRVTV